MRKIVLVLLLLALPAAGWAASFDCGKAQTKVEKLICDNPKISKLDDDIGKAYQEALNKASEEQKQQLATEQKHWLKHTRNTCADEPCFKQAYWLRLAALATFFEPMPASFEKEADKAEPIKQILATYPFYESTTTDRPFCEKFLENLKQMKGISFVAPILRVQSYEDPALDPWKQQCKSSPPFHYSAGCEPSVVFNWLDPASSEKERYRYTLELCAVGYGVPPFKFFELPPVGKSGKKRYIFYSERSYGPMNQEWNKPHIGGGSAGYRQVDFSTCKPVFDVEFSGTETPGNNSYNGIVNYKLEYYFLKMVNEGSESQPAYWLTVESVTPLRSKNHQLCRWAPAMLKQNQSNQGRK